MSWASGWQVRHPPSAPLNLPEVHNPNKDGLEPAGIGVATFTCCNCGGCTRRPPLPSTSQEETKKRVWKLDKLQSLLGASSQLAGESLVTPPCPIKTHKQTQTHTIEIEVSSFTRITFRPLQSLGADVCVFDDGAVAGRAETRGTSRKE